MSYSRSNVAVNLNDRLWGIGDIAAMSFAGVAILFAAAFFNLVSLDADKDKVQLDFQVYLKLMIVMAAILYGVYGFLPDNRVRSTALTFPAVWILILFCFYLCGLPTIAWIIGLTWFQFGPDGLTENS